MSTEVAFECWEIAFGNDPDGEPTRGISRVRAEQMVSAGLLTVQSEGIVTNTAGQRVMAHTYAPAEGQEDAAWDAWSAVQ